MVVTDSLLIEVLVEDQAARFISCQGLSAAQLGALNHAAALRARRRYIMAEMVGVEECLSSMPAGLSCLHLEDSSRMHHRIQQRPRSTFAIPVLML
jgi:hypothetical protein